MLQLQGAAAAGPAERHAQAPGVWEPRRAADAPHAPRAGRGHGGGRGQGGPRLLRSPRHSHALHQLPPRDLPAVTGNLALHSDYISNDLTLTDPEYQYFEEGM